MIDRHVLMAHFDQSVDMSGGLLSAAMDKEHSLTFSLLAQLSGTMEEHGVEDVGRIVQSVEKTGQIPEIFARLRILKLVAGGVFGIFLLASLTYIFWKFRMVVCGCLRRMRKRSRKHPSSVVTGQELLPLREPGQSMSEITGTVAKEPVVQLYPYHATLMNAVSYLRVIGSVG